MPESPKIVFNQVRTPGESIDVSVIIPVYNGASTLGEELEALARQKTDYPFEVLIADNGSTDGTREVATGWADRFAAFTIVDAGQVRGAGHARNQGAWAAKGRKLLFCDADDVVCPEWLEALSAALDIYDAAGGTVRLDKINSHASVRGHEIELTGLNSIFGFLPYPLAGTLGVKRDVFLKIGGFDLSFNRGHEEADFGWRLQLAGYKLGSCPQAVVDYRQRADSYQAARQHFNYAKSSILLWCRYAQAHPLSPVSLRASMRNFAQQIPRSYRFLIPDRRREQARSLGWCAGVFAGHIVYRIFGLTPGPALLEYGANPMNSGEDPTKPQEEGK